MFIHCTGFPILIFLCGFGISELLFNFLEEELGINLKFTDMRIIASWCESLVALGKAGNTFNTNS